MKKILEIVLIFVFIFSLSIMSYKFARYFEAQTKYMESMTRLIELQNEYIYWILEQE
jgi:hypothetical protein